LSKQYLCYDTAMDIITWIGLFIMVFSVAAGWAQVAEIVERHRREREHEG
jgi:hypothetical protein